MILDADLVDNFAFSVLSTATFSIDCRSFDVFNAIGDAIACSITSQSLHRISVVDPFSISSSCIGNVLTDDFATLALRAVSAQPRAAVCGSARISELDAINISHDELFTEVCFSAKI